MNKKLSLIFVLLAFVSIAKKGFSNDTAMFYRIIDLTIYQTTELSVNYYFPEDIDTKMKLVRRMNQSSITYNEYPFVFSWDYNSINSPKESYSKITLGETYLKVISPINLLRYRCCADKIILDSIAPIPPIKSTIPFIQKMMDENPIGYKLFRLKLIYGISQIKLEFNTNNQQAKSKAKPMVNSPKKSSLLWAVIGYGLIVLSIIGIVWFILLFIAYRRLNKLLVHELDEEKEKYISLKKENSTKTTRVSNHQKQSIEKEKSIEYKQEIPASTKHPSSQSYEPKPLIILEEAYLPAPDEAGIFIVTNQRNSVNSSESVFHIKQKNKNSNEYEFSIINDENIWVRALSYADVFLDPVCDIDFNSVEKGKRINVLQKGLLVKENGNYKTVKKIKIKIES